MSASQQHSKKREGPFARRTVNAYSEDVQVEKFLFVSTQISAGTLELALRFCACFVAKVTGCDIVVCARQHSSPRMVSFRECALI